MKDLKFEEIDGALHLLATHGVVDIASMIQKFTAANGYPPKKIYLPGGFKVMDVEIGILPELKEWVAI